MYPLYGLSDISQAFSRVSSAQGVTYRLKTEIKEILPEEKRVVVKFLDPFDDFKLKSVSSKALISNPDQSFNRKELVNEVIRCTCIIKGRVPLVSENSAQVIFLASDIRRKNDIFLMVLSDEEKTTPKGYSLAIISTVKETENPNEEIKVATSRVGYIKHMFLKIEKIYKPNVKEGRVFVTKSLDHTPHIENSLEDVNGILRELQQNEFIEK